MLSKILIAASLLIASGSALADRDGYVYGRVLAVEPSFSLSIGGGRHNDGFRIQYETGGQRYWTHSHTRPRDVIYVPRPVYVEPAYVYSEPVYYDTYRAYPGWHRGWPGRRGEWRERHDDGYGRGHDRGYRDND